MKKIYVLFTCLFFTFIITKAQVNYNFSASSGTYIAISGGTSPTLLPNQNGPESDEGFANGLPIGFSFTYNGTAYTTIGVSANGFAYFGSGGLSNTSNTFTNNLTSDQANTVRPIIAPLWDDLDLQANANLHFTTSGSAPNRIFTLQWANAKWTYSGTSAAISFQLKLFETTGVIQFIYNQEAGALTGSASASIGLTTSATGPGAFLSLQNATASPTTSTTTETATINVKPATGQIYTFTPLSGCSSTPTPGTSSSNLATACSNQAFTLSLTGQTSATGIGVQWQRSNTGANTWTNIIGATTAIVTTSQTLASDYRCVVTCTNSSLSANSTVTSVTLSAINCPPTCVNNVSPANAATNVTYNPNIPLSWNASAGATSYDVYFGTTTTPSFLANTFLTNISVSGASANTTYYWYVVPKNANGNLTNCNGNLTSFTTGAAPAAPSNNECVGAISISAYTGSANGTTVGATASVSIPGTCTGDPDDDVWYSFVARQNGTATITVVGGTGFDAVVGCYSGSCGSLTLLGTCVDATGSGDTEILNVSGLVGLQTYYVRVFDYFTNTSGTFTIRASGAALPVSIISFTGERQGTINNLSWSTSTEVNNSGFELLRSADGTNFSTLGFVASKASNGNSNATLNYEFADKKPFTGNAYYRLKQIDKDDKTTLSQIVLIKGIKLNKLELTSVYPNPTINTLNVVVSSPKADKVTFVVSDITGKVIMNQIMQVVVGDNNLPINVSHIAKGTYTIKAICADGCETAISKFVK